MSDVKAEKPKVYRVDGGWKHIKCGSVVFPDYSSAATDYRFCCEWEKD